MKRFRRLSFALLTGIILSAVPLACQSLTLSQDWLPAASGSEPIQGTFSTIPPETYALLSEGSLAVRWNGQLLPATMVPPFNAEAAFQFTVPAAQRLPGLTRFELWDTSKQQPLPYEGWISVVFPSPTPVFEADPSSDRVVAAVSPNDNVKYGQVGPGGQITVYRLSTGAVTQTITVDPAQRVLTFTPDTGYAWVAQSEAQGSLARLNLTTGQFDQPIQITGGTQPYAIQAQVLRGDPRIVMVTATGNGIALATQAYLNGALLPGAAPAGVTVPAGIDDKGGIVSSRYDCQITAAAGFTNCLALMGTGFSFQAVWKDKGLAVSYGCDVVNVNTGAVLLPSYCYYAAYLAATNRVALAAGSSFQIADADILQVDTVATVPEAIGPPRVWAPDWVSVRTQYGVLVGELPQMGPAPSIAAGGVINAATGLTGPVTSGEIISIFGSNLGPAAGAGPVTKSGLKLATTVEDTQVLFDGIPGSILYAGAGQINTVVPETVQGASSVAVQVVHFGIPSPIVTEAVASASPGIFGYQVQGKTYAAALTAAGQLEGPSTPLVRGTAVSLYGTGIGLPSGETADSVGARAAQVPVTPTVLIGGQPAQVLYAGVSPGFTLGLSQVNVIVPANAPVGSAVGVTISLGGINQGNVWVGIQ